MSPYAILLARPGATIENCDTPLCFIHADTPQEAHQAAAIEAAAADGLMWEPDDYAVIAIFEGFHPGVSI